MLPRHEAVAGAVHRAGLGANSSNMLPMHAMGPNVAGALGSAVVAGVLWLCSGSWRVPGVSHVSRFSSGLRLP